MKKTKIDNKNKYWNSPEISRLIEFNDEFITTVKGISVNYSYPQFAQQVLSNFHNKINEIENIVKKIYYYNIDAVLIDEEDYNKLCSLNYIGNELGQFKIEHIFNEIGILSARKYMAKTINGEIINHTTNKNKNYEEFIKEILSSPDTTVIN